MALRPGARAGASSWWRNKAKKIKKSKKTRAKVPSGSAVSVLSAGLLLPSPPPENGSAQKRSF